MKILWFTNTPSNAHIEFGNMEYGGGWISSLETLMSESGMHELGICFYYDGSTFKKIAKGNVVYYGLPTKRSFAIGRVLARHTTHVNDEDSKYIEKVIDDFKPELIHVFGTENGFGSILKHHSIKVLFHLQGLVAPISEVFFPRGFNKLKILKNSKGLSILKGITFLYDYRLLKKRGEREQKTIQQYKYFSGRTNWDKNYVQLTNSEARYFHCDELLRKEFFLYQWMEPSDLHQDSEIVIGTTINPNLYKGLDLIYKVMVLLKGYTIRWKIFGIREEDQVNSVVKRILNINHAASNIEFQGQLNPTRLIEELKTCHFFVHPSYIDNSPNSVCEAMLLGMPVLSSSVGGIPTLIENGKTGFLFNPYDKYDLAGLLVQLIGDYEKAKCAGIKARQAALERHSPDAIFSKINAIYDFIRQDKS